MTPANTEVALLRRIVLALVDIADDLISEVAPEWPDAVRHRETLGQVLLALKPKEPAS